MRDARTLITMTLAMVLLVGCEKYALDRQMEELCKKDGGIRVYETVKLPASMFDQNGSPAPGTKSREIEDRLGPSYQLVREEAYLKQGNPVKGEGQLRRTHWKITRKSDGKLLGEAVRYGRSGGDFIALGHFSSNSCPLHLGGDEPVVRAVFIKEGN